MREITPKRLGFEMHRALVAATSSMLLCLTGCGAAQPEVDRAEARTVVTTPCVPPQRTAYLDPAQAAQVAHREPGTEWIKLPLMILFQDRDAVLDDNDRALLDHVQEVLSSRTDIVRVLVGGHAEEGPDERRRHRLSRERANVAVDYLVNELSMSRELFEAVGRGSCCPLTCDVGNCHNRFDDERVEIWALVEQRESDERR